MIKFLAADGKFTSITRRIWGNTMNAIIKENVTKTNPYALQATQTVEKPGSESVTMTEAERKKAEALKRINACIDRHESLLIKLAK